MLLLWTDVTCCRNTLMHRSLHHRTLYLTGVRAHTNIYSTPFFMGGGGVVGFVALNCYRKKVSTALREMDNNRL